MKMAKRYENLEDALCKELEILDKKYGGQANEMTIQDVEKADKIYHALKSAETYHAMADAEWEEDGEDESGARRDLRDGHSYARGRSYRRGRDSMGRYTTRDGRYSGHWPMYPRYPVSYEYPHEDW